MDVSNFLGGSLATQADLPQPAMLCTITGAEQKQVGQGASVENKVCISVAELQKQIACNKTNLGRIADLYGTNAAAWQGKQILVYRSATDFQGKRTLCIRVCGPQQPPVDPVCDLHGNAVAYQPPTAAPAPAPQTQQPVAAPQPQQPQASEQPPWTGHQ